MKFLVFDTCFNKSYIVLWEDEKILADIVINSTEENYHSAFLMPEITNILKQNNILIQDLDAIGVNIGPGSFTGIRAGITIARVFAQATNKKLVGISSLEILSKLNDNKDKKTIVTLDARKNKVYFAEYKNDKTITEPVLIDKEELTNKINSDDFIIVDESISTYLLDKGITALNYENNDKNIGHYLADIVYSCLQKNENNFNWASVKPLYIQKPSITLPKAVKNV